jgi:hypothetical protein
MARPVKNNLEYFSHDKDMRNDLRIKALRRKYSHKGYSIYVMMLEHLSNCDYLQYEWSELSIELLTPDFDVDSAELVEIINYCVKLKLFEIELGYIFSQKFYERNQVVLVGRKDFNLINSPLSKLKANQLSKMEINTQSKVKNSIVEESKVEHSKVEESKEQESKEQESKIEESIIEEMDNLKDKIKIKGWNSLPPAEAARYYILRDLVK